MAKAHFIVANGLSAFGIHGGALALVQQFVGVERQSYGAAGADGSQGGANAKAEVPWHMDDM